MENRNRFTRLVIGALILFIIILVLFFFWGELAGLSTLKKISHEKFNAFFTSLGAIFTATSIFFLYKQNKMLQEERKLSVQPDLFLKSIKLVTEDVRMNDFDAYAPIFTFNENHYKTKEIYIEIHNIGLGTAKQISIMWYYDTEQVKEMVQKVYAVNDAHFDIIQFNNIDFLKINDSNHLRIPYGYLALLGDRILKPFDINSNEPRQQLPKLELVVNYSDNYNHIEHKRFELIAEKYFKTIKISFQQITSQHT